MTTETIDDTAASALESIRGMRDALSVGRVFGDPYEMNGVTVIPVARLAGGAGGGGGGGKRNTESGSGFGSGFGLRADPVGVYQVQDGHVTWKPTLDATRLAKSVQVLAGIVTICFTLVALRRPRRKRRPEG